MTDIPNPIDHLFGTFTAFHRSAAIKAALELDLFTTIVARATTPDAIAARTGADARGVRILCDALAVLGFLEHRDAGYRVAADYAPFLDAKSPVYLGTCVRFMQDPTFFDGFARLTDAVRRGGTAVTEHDALEPENPMWVEFARAMAPLAGVSAEILAILLAAETLGKVRVLDIAAGHGLFGIALAKRNPVLEVTALDWANVLAVAVENAEKAGVADRLRTRPGDAFKTDLGSNYDLVLVPNLIHHFDAAACEALFRRVHAALKPGGRIVIVEFIPDEDRHGPATAVMFGLVMLAMTPGGDVYTLSECSRMLERAGFRKTTLHALTPSPQQVVIAERSQ